MRANKKNRNASFKKTPIQNSYPLKIPVCEFTFFSPRRIFVELTSFPNISVSEPTTESNSNKSPTSSPDPKDRWPCSKEPWPTSPPTVRPSKPVTQPTRTVTNRTELTSPRRPRSQQRSKSLSDTWPLCRARPNRTTSERDRRRPARDRFSVSSTLAVKASNFSTIISSLS